MFSRPWFGALLVATLLQGFSASAADGVPTIDELSSYRTQPIPLPTIQDRISIPTVDGPSIRADYSSYTSARYSPREEAPTDKDLATSAVKSFAFDSVLEQMVTVFGEDLAGKVFGWEFSTSMKTFFGMAEGWLSVLPWKDIVVEYGGQAAASFASGFLIGFTPSSTAGPELDEIHYDAPPPPYYGDINSGSGDPITQPPATCSGPCCDDPCCGDPCCGDPCCGDPCCGDPCCGDPCCGDPCCGDPECEGLTAAQRKTQTRVNRQGMREATFASRIRTLGYWNMAPMCRAKPSAAPLSSVLGTRAGCPRGPTSWAKTFLLQNSPRTKIQTAPTSQRVP